MTRGMGLALLLGLVVGACASGGRDTDSETHFVCTNDEECMERNLGERCVQARCVPTVVTSSSDPACIDFAVPERFSYTRADESTPGLSCDHRRIDVNECAGEGEFIAFEMMGEDFELWISFEPTVLGNYTEESLRDRFRVLWYRLKYPTDSPEQPFTSRRIYVESIDAFDTFAYTDGRLKLKMHTEMTSIIRWVEPEGDSCYDGDVAPYTCLCDYPLEVPVTIDLDLVFPP